MKISTGAGSKVFDILNTAFMIFLMIIMLYPMLYVLSISLSSPAAIVGHKVTFFPVQFNIYGYQYILQQKFIYIGYRNTIFYAAATCLLMLIVTSMAAYSLSQREFVFKKAFTIFLTITMFFGGGMIPTYLLIRGLGMINTIWVMILPGIVSAYNIFVFRSFFQGLPGELRESAFIDGANDFVILLRIIIPLSKPVFATYGLFAIVGTWNSWFNALLYLTNENLYPIQMFLRRIVVDLSLDTQYGNSGASLLLNAGKVNPQNIQMAMVMITMFPILCIYPFIQKYFVKGALVGAIKG